MYSLATREVAGLAKEDFQEQKKPVYYLNTAIDRDCDILPSAIDALLLFLLVCVL
jgi:hypothetical protein